MSKLSVVFLKAMLVLSISHIANAVTYVPILMDGITIIIPLGDDVEVDLPPDPGADGHTTLAGIDSDGDGLRDDIQRLIAIAFKNDEEAVAQYRALAEHKIYLIDAPYEARPQNVRGDIWVSLKLEHYASMKELEYCIIKNDGRDALKFILKLEAWINSTFERDRGYSSNIQNTLSMIDYHSQYQCNGGPGIVSYLDSITMTSKEDIGNFPPSDPTR